MANWQKKNNTLVQNTQWAQTLFFYSLINDLSVFACLKSRAKIYAQIPALISLSQLTVAVFFLRYLIINFFYIAKLVY